MKNRIYKILDDDRKVVITFHQIGDLRKPILVGVITFDGDVETVHAIETLASNSHAEAAANLFDAKAKVDEWVDRHMRWFWKGACERIK